MLNRRKLIQLILSELPAERTYFDFKQALDVISEPGRGKLVRTIAALANSNRSTPSFVVVGVEDGSRALKGAEPLDDTKVQQLVREHLSPAPRVTYELVPIPNSGSKVFVGLLTIHPQNDLVLIAKNFWKLKAGSVYVRDGSESRLVAPGASVPEYPFAAEVNDLLTRASVRLADTLSGLLAFYARAGKEYHPEHIVYNDLHVVCHSGWRGHASHPNLRSEVLVELLPENISLFWGAQTEVTIDVWSQEFVITEHLTLLFRGQVQYLPFERVSIAFRPDGTWAVDKTIIFQTPTMTADEIAELLDVYQTKLEQLTANKGIGDPDWEMLPDQLLIAALNGSLEARRCLENYMEGRADGAVAGLQHAAVRAMNRVLGA